MHMVRAALMVVPLLLPAQGHCIHTAVLLTWHGVCEHEGTDTAALLTWRGVCEHEGWTHTAMLLTWRGVCEHEGWTHMDV